MNAHLTEEEIGRFIEKNCSEIDAARIYVHLCSCKTCFAEYQFAARWRGVWITDQEVFKSSEDLIAYGKEISLAPARPSGRWKRFVAAMTSTRGLRIASVGAAAVIVAAGWFWLGTEPDSLPQKVINPIRVAAEEVTYRGAMVIPGTETSADASTTPYRSFYVAGNDSLSESLDYLVKEYAGGEIPRDAFRWLITGFLVTAQLVPASDYAREAVVRYPDDAEIATLAALVAYHRNDLDESERLLRAAVKSDPGYLPGLFNLLAVLVAQDDHEQALKTFAALEHQQPEGPLTLRAKTLFSLD